MRSGMALSGMGCLALWVAAGHGVAGADEIVVDSHRVRDWARVMTSYAWKDQDSILQPAALLQFDLSGIPAGVSIDRGVLRFFVERSHRGSTIALDYVEDDSWTFLFSRSSALCDWPVHHRLASYATGTTGWRQVDLTDDVQRELEKGNRILSVKITDAKGSYAAERILSPSAFLSDRRPQLRIRVSSKRAPLPPDLSITGHDITLKDPWAAPGRSVPLTVTLHNNGGPLRQAVQMRLYEGDPNAGGNVVATLVFNSIPGGGGIGTKTITWKATAGLHRIWAVVDPEKKVEELDETDNQAFLDIPILSRYDSFQEGFELAGVNGQGTLAWPGLQNGYGAWVADAEVPSDANIGLARQWQLVPTRTAAFKGLSSLYMYLDGGSDDGTVWIERWLPVRPDSTVEVSLQFAFGTEPDLATSPVYYIGTSDPETESDFARMNLQSGWAVYDTAKTVKTGSSNRLWIAVGLTVTWETRVHHYLDDVSVSLREVVESERVRARQEE